MVRRRRLPKRMERGRMVFWILMGKTLLWKTLMDHQILSRRIQKRSCQIPKIRQKQGKILVLPAFVMQSIRKTKKMRKS